MSAIKLINEITEDLEGTWDMESEQLNDIREKLLVFAKAVSESPSMTEEIKKIAKDL